MIKLKNPLAPALGVGIFNAAGYELRFHGIPLATITKNKQFVSFEAILNFAHKCEQDITNIKAQVDEAVKSGDYPLAQQIAVRLNEPMRFVSTAHLLLMVNNNVKTHLDKDMDQAPSGKGWNELLITDPSPNPEPVLCLVPIGDIKPEQASTIHYRYIYRSKL